MLDPSIFENLSYGFQLFFFDKTQEVLSMYNQYIQLCYVEIVKNSECTYEKRDIRISNSYLNQMIQFSLMRKINGFV